MNIPIPHDSPNENHTLIWRVQNKSGRGPYGFDAWPRDREYECDELHWDHSCDDTRPGPATDFGPYSLQSQKKFFGFLLEKDARRWFYEWLGRLRDAGFELVQVEGNVTDFGVSRYSGQVAYIPTRGNEPVKKAA